MCKSLKFCLVSPCSCTFEISFNYEIQVGNMKQIYNTYGMKYEDLAIIPIARSRLRDVIAQYTVRDN